MANMHVITDGRLVEDPRTFETKDGTTLVSIRVADNPPKGSKYVPSFVGFTLNEKLSEIVLERGLAKGDIVAVGGELREREYEKKGKGKKKAKGGEKGRALEIAYVSLFRIVKCAADDTDAAGPDEEDEPETDDTEAETEETEENAAPFDSVEE